MTTTTDSTIQLVPDLHKARQRCRSLMDQHGLYDWKLRMTKTLRRLGRCMYRDKTIEVSRYQPGADPDDTVLHEIAHALTPWAGHGPIWQAKCRQIGANPVRCQNATHGAGLGYRIICNKCQSKLATTARKSRILHRCRSKCCGATVTQEKN